MNKKIIISIITAIILIIAIEVFVINKNNEKIKENENIVVNNITNISLSEYVSDECENEWEDYAIGVEETLQASSKITKSAEKHFKIKELDKKIIIYFIDEDEREILERKTDISTDYLAPKDLEEIKKGIDVYGEEELNKLLEDFE